MDVTLLVSFIFAAVGLCAFIMAAIGGKDD